MGCDSRDVLFLVSAAARLRRMAVGKGPVTAAVRALRAGGVTFTEHLYDYEERGGTRVSARELGIDEHSIVKTLVMEESAAFWSESTRRSCPACCRRPWSTSLFPDPDPICWSNA